MSDRIYLDHCATTAIDAAVMDACIAAARIGWANPSSPYDAAAEARRILHTGCRTMARILGGDSSQIIFTSGGTESNALALWQVAGEHVVLSATEHASVTEAAENFGCSITYVAPDADGIIHPEAVAAAIRPDTALISVQYANNETGAVQPIWGIGKLARSRRILFHCDAVQAFGQIPVDVKESNIDLLSASAHKIYGPRGAGLLFMSDRVNRRALIPGSQQFGIRGGTENIPAIAGFTKAAEQAEAQMLLRAEKATRLRLLLRQLLGENQKLLFPADHAPRLPGVLSVILPEMESEEAILRLDGMGIQVSGGAACATGNSGGSHVIRAMGYTQTEAKRALRISIGKENTEAEIRTAAEAILGLCK